MARKKTSISGQKTRIYSRFLHTVKTSLLRSASLDDFAPNVRPQTEIKNHFRAPSPSCKVSLLKVPIVSVNVLGGVVQRQEFARLRGRIQNGVLSLWSVRVFWFQTRSERTFLDPKMEGKYATEYSTEKGVKVLKVTMAWAIRAWRTDRYMRPRTYKRNIRFTHDHERLRKVWKQITDYGASRDFWKQSDSWMDV